MARPLSPHLQIYHPAMTMIMSIAHRISGIALYAAMLGGVGWLIALAFAPPLFNIAQAWFSTMIGQIILLLMLWAFCHHLFGGLRHFLWDMGYGMGVYAREWLVWGSFILGICLTAALFWGPHYELILRRVL